MEPDDLLQYIESVKALYTKQRHTNEWMEGADTALAAIYNRICTDMHEEDDDNDLPPDKQALRDHIDSTDPD